MRKYSWLLALVTLIGPWAATAWTESPPTAEKPQESKATAESDSSSGTTNRQAEREQRFKEMLSGSLLKGTWQMVQCEEGKPLTGKPLSDPRPEEYTISKVSKASDDYWVIVARIKYADKDVNIPIMVRVVWAEDTPIITLDNMSLPGLGTYSARVMVYRDFYCGTWFGDCYGGILSGQIVKPAAPTSPDDDAKPRPEPKKQPSNNTTD